MDMVSYYPILFPNIMAVNLSPRILAHGGRPAFYHTIGGVGHGFHQHEALVVVKG